MAASRIPADVRVTEARGARRMSATTSARFRAAIVAVAPAVLLAGFLYHPYHPGPPDLAAIATAAASNPTRWGLAHLAIAVGSGLVVLAFLAVRVSLRQAGEERWSVLAVPFIVMAGTLYTLPPGMEFTPLAAAEAGADGRAAQAALVPWIAPVLLAGGFLFALGVFGFARGIARSGMLSPGLTRLVVGALATMAVARLMPLTEVQFYVQGAAGIVALWPLAYEIAKHSGRAAGHTPASPGGDLIPSPTMMSERRR